MTTPKNPKPLTEAKRKEAARLGLPIIDGKSYDYDEHDIDAVIRGLRLDGIATEAARKARMAVRKKES